MSEKENNLSEVLLATTRISLGWVFFWAFIDKTFGLGFYWYQEQQFGTPPDQAWIQGKNPITGFLLYGTQDKWFHDFFASMADSQLVAFLYMLGLFGIGISMILGIFRKIGGIGGAILMLLMWLAQLPLTNNPIIDDHVIYAMLLLIFGLTPHFGREYSLAPMWEEMTPTSILE